MAAVATDYEEMVQRGHVQYVEAYPEHSELEEEIIFMDEEEEEEVVFMDECTPPPEPRSTPNSNSNSNSHRLPTESCGGSPGSYYDSGRDFDSPSKQSLSGGPCHLTSSSNPGGHNDRGESTNRTDSSMMRTSKQLSSANSNESDYDSPIGYVSEVDPTTLEEDDYQQFKDDYSDEPSSETARIFYDDDLLGPLDIAETDEVGELIAFYRNDREFCFAAKHSLSRRQTVRVMSWNILADGPSYALSPRHSYCPRQQRWWEYRRPRIVASAVAYEPDLCCFQETTHRMHEDLMPFFKHYGFEGIRVPTKRRSALSLSFLYRSDRFELMCYEHAVLGPLSDQFGHKIFGPSRNMFRSFLRSKDNAVIVAKLRDRWSPSGQQLVVVGSHLFWDPMRPHIKSAQIFIVNEFLVDLLTKPRSAEWRVPGVDYSASGRTIMESVPIVFCCDSNTVPKKVSCVSPKVHILSGVGKIMAEGKLDRNHLDHPLTQYRLRFARSLAVDSEFNPVLAKQQKMVMEQIGDWHCSVPLRWRSAYDSFNARQRSKIEHAKPAENECIFTNKVGEFCDTIDYLFVTPSVDVVGVLKMPYDKSSVEREFAERESTRHRQGRMAEYRAFHSWHRHSIKEIRRCLDVHRSSLLLQGFLGEAVPPPIRGLLMHFLCSEEEWRRRVEVHDKFVLGQSLWRMVRMKARAASHCTESACFSAWDYPQMPNRKDPSDHFALCAEIVIGRSPDALVRGRETDTESESDSVSESTMFQITNPWRHRLSF